MAVAGEAVRKENPLALGTPKALLPQPCVLTIFGGNLRPRLMRPSVLRKARGSSVRSNAHRAHT